MLLNGDHLSVPEFERRYEAMQDDARAELIEGIVVMSPGIKSGPVTMDHGKAHSLMNCLLGHYAVATPGVSCAVGASLRLDGCNEYQPDVLLWIEQNHLDGVKADPVGILEGRPELVMEVALSGRAFDLHEKKAVLQRNQIPEYIVWEMLDEPRFHWFALEDGEYASLQARRDSVVCSRVFPGLWLDFASLVVGQGSDKEIFRALNKGLKSAEHKAFVKKLAASSR